MIELRINIYIMRLQNARGGKLQSNMNEELIANFLASQTTLMCNFQSLLVCLVSVSRHLNTYIRDFMTETRGGKLTQKIEDSGQEALRTFYIVTTLRLV